MVLSHSFSDTELTLGVRLLMNNIKRPKSISCAWKGHQARHADKTEPNLRTPEGRAPVWYTGRVFANQPSVCVHLCVTITFNTRVR